MAALNTVGEDAVLHLSLAKIGKGCYRSNVAAHRRMDEGEVTIIVNRTPGLTRIPAEGGVAYDSNRKELVVDAPPPSLAALLSTAELTNVRFPELKMPPPNPLAFAPVMVI